MVRQPEYEDDDAPSGARSSDSKEAGGSTSPSNTGFARMLVRLKLIANYVIDGFPPVVAVIALIVAVFAVNDNKSSQAQLSKAAAKIDSMSASLLASKGELEKLKVAMAQEKVMREEEHKKQEERVTQIIQGVSKLQVKMKISPTLEEQLHQPVSAAVTSSVASAASAPASAAPAPAKTDVSTGTVKKPGTQVQILKESIEKFNKK